MFRKLKTLSNPVILPHSVFTSAKLQTVIHRKPRFWILFFALATMGLTSPRAQKVEPNTMADFMGTNASIAIYGNGELPLVSPVFQWLREYHIWDHWEHTPNLYTWANPIWGLPNHTEFLKNCQSDFIQVLISVDQAVSWSSSNATASGIPYDNGKGTEENNYRKRGGYAAQLAARYGATRHPITELKSSDQKTGLNYVNYYEDFNEEDEYWSVPTWPASMYAKCLNVMHDGYHCENSSAMPLVGIKQGDPTAFHVMGGLCGADRAYLDGVLANTGGRLPFDEINFHFYCTDNTKAYCPEHAVHGLKPSVDQMKAWRDAKAPGKPIWITEFGWDTYDNGSGGHSYVYAPFLAQANYLMRSFALLKGWGIEKAFMFQFDDVDSAKITQYSSSGVVMDKANGFAKKTSYYYLGTMKNTLGALLFEKADRYAAGNSEVYAYVFKDSANKHNVCMLWNRGVGAAIDSGVKSNHYSYPIPYAVSCTQIKPLDGSMTGTTTILAVSHPGTASAKVVIPQLSETPLFLSCTVSRRKPQNQSEARSN